jgi:hypothetical protein
MSAMTASSVATASAVAALSARTASAMADPGNGDSSLMNIVNPGNNPRDLIGPIFNKSVPLKCQVL